MTVDPYLLLGVAKLFAVVWLFLGVGWAVTGSARARRVRAAYGFACWGLVAAWVAGWWVMKITDRSITEPWILGTAVASLGALELTLRAVHADAPSRLQSRGAMGGLGASVALMGLRPVTPLEVAVVALVGAVLMALVVPSAAEGAPSTPREDREEVVRGFGRLAWAEGLSFLFLLGFATPLHRLGGIDLDGETGVIGWTHGVLLIVYLQALTHVARELDWGWREVGMGVAAGLVPGGPFVFERRLLHGAAADQD